MSQVHFERNTQTGNTKHQKPRSASTYQNQAPEVTFREETKSHKQS